MFRKLIAIAILVGAFAVPAAASDGSCVQADGQVGVRNGTPGDEGCITAAEYAELYSITNLVDVGVFTSAVDNGDGTATVTHALGGTSIVRVDPLSRPVAATPSLEPDAPTVGDILFSTRAVTGGGPQES